MPLAKHTATIPALGVEKAMERVEKVMVKQANHVAVSWAMERATGRVEKEEKATGRAETVMVMVRQEVHFPVSRLARVTRSL